MANKTYVAYCGGKMGCNGYITPRKSNISNITAGNGADWTNIGGINETDGDAFVFETNENGGELKLHIFRTSCSPIMSCTYNGGGNTKIISNSANIWKKVIDGKTIMTDGPGRISGTADNPNTVEYSFVNEYGDIPYDTNNGMFANCTSLTSCSIPCQMRNIADYTFSGCTSLTSYSNPSCIDTIGEYAFAGCTSLSSLEIGEFAAISPYSFAGCSGASTIDWCGLSSSNSKCRMTAIPNNAFAECSNLNSTRFSDGSFQGLVIPKGITYIGDSAFYNCSDITSVDLSNVTSIGDSAFTDCSSISSVDLSDVTSIGNGAFAFCSAMSTLTIGTGVTSIEDYCFMRCASLTSLNLSDNVTEVGTQAFYHCDDLTDVTIGSGVTKMKARAFMSCESLDSFTIKATTPPTITSTTFSSVPSTCKFYVPSGSVEAYKTATNWSSKASQIYPIT